MNKKTELLCSSPYSYWFSISRIKYVCPTLY